MQRKQRIKQVPKKTDILRTQQFEWTRRENDCDDISTLLQGHFQIGLTCAEYTAFYKLFLFSLVIIVEPYHEINVD